MRQFLFRRLTLFIFCFLSTSLFSQAYLEKLDVKDLQRMIDDIVDTTDIPGIQLILVSRDSLVHHVFSGKRAAHMDSKMKANDLMHLGSNTKSMTAFVAASLIEEGLINWDTKFFDLFPDLKSKALKAYHEITLKDLFQHRAFIPSYTDDEEFDKLPKLTDEPILIQRIKWFEEILSMKPLEIDSTSGYTYSNAGYTMAAAMLEKVSNKTYEELMEGYLFKPLQINGRFGWPENYGEDQPMGHYIHENEDTVSYLRPEEEYQIGRMIAPAGDVCLSSKDYARYLQAQLKGLNGEEDVLRSESYHAMHDLNKEETMYALGWGVADVEIGEKVYTISTHDGSGGTYLCKTILIPALNTGISILINSGEEHHAVVTKKLRNRILKKIFIMAEE